MEQLALKKAIFDKVIQQQTLLIADIAQRIKDLKESMASVEVGSFGGSDDARREEDVEGLQTEKTHLDFAQAELQKLQELAKHITLNSSVVGGAIIKTNHFNFIFAINMPQLIHDGVSYFVVSEQAPLFKALEGKKLGESAQINGHTHTILQLM
ncbi:hypothetical protein [Flectobacillus major]|uniref:hypothetical protein n=1 Tax=Flectobacillus major TaxID=103 RepID=UPI0003F75412|nr:hypothetical protein [Flectobacillus major]